MTDLSKLTDAEINAAVAVDVMGWKLAPLPNCWITGMLAVVGNFSPATDYNDCATMRAEIARHGLEHVFARTLSDMLLENDQPRKWNLINASPRQQCESALRAVRSAK